MKNGEVLTLYETLDKLSKDYNLKFNVRVGYIMAKNKERLRQEAAIIYNQRQRIIMEHGTFDENHNIIIDKQYIDDTNKKINELMELENDVLINVIDPDDLDHNILSLSDIEGLLPMFRSVWFTGPPMRADEKTPE